MNEQQYQTIVKIITAGAPVLAEELVGCINNLIQHASKLQSELDELKKAQNSGDEAKSDEKSPAKAKKATKSE